MASHRIADIDSPLKHVEFQEIHVPTYLSRLGDTTLLKRAIPGHLSLSNWHSLWLFGNTLQLQSDAATEVLRLGSLHMGHAKPRQRRSRMRLARFA